MTEIIINQDQAEQRLDRFLKKHLPYSTVQRLIRKRLIRVNNKRQKADYVLVSGDIVKYPDSISLDQQTGTASTENHLKDWIIFEDDQLLVLNKPSGIAVQGGTGIKFSIDDAVKIYPHARLVHRLDRETSGILLVALTAAMARHLAQCFKDHQTEKTYWAVVDGAPTPPQGEINAALLRPQGEKCVQVRKDGKQAQTHYKTLQRNRTAAWLELTPKTGRTHQLRAHCRHLGHPIKGDRLYNPKPGNTPLHLHARQIKVPALDTKHMLQFTADLPGHMVETFDLAGWSVL